MPNINVSVNRRGPVFNIGQAESRAKQMITSINEAVAQEGLKRVHAHLAQNLQHPTGHYQSRIVIDRKATQRFVGDSRVKYGGWLEGVTSRNRATRFKGYHTFRTVKESLDRDSAKIAEPIVAQFAREMNS